MLLAHRKSQGEPSTLLQGMCQEPTLPTTWPSLGPLDRTSLTPQEMGVAAVAVEAAEMVEVAEERHHPDPEGQDMERLSPPHVDNKLYGQNPDIFTGDKRKAREFITQWDLYRSLNFNVAMMRMPYTQAMLFLTFFKGPLTANWTSVMNRHLNTQV